MRNPKPLARSLVRASVSLFLLTLAVLGAAGCGPSRLLSNVTASREVITPHSDADAEPVYISYELGRAARVSILLTGADGTAYPYRSGEQRSPGEYSARFTGVYTPENDGPERRVLPNGTYTYAVIAEADGQTERSEGRIRIEGADTEPPVIGDLSVLPDVFSPNGDNVDDETLLGYSLSKVAYVTIIAYDKDNQAFLLKPETKLDPQLHSLRWDGTAGERLLRDGVYQVYIRARDMAGNVTRQVVPVTVAGAGIPRLEITSVRFWPLAMPVGGTLNVEITVKNTGESPLRSLGPDPGAPYDTFQNFMKFQDETGQPKFFERPGYWRVGIQWEQAASPYPVRWGWGDQPLNPGEEATITGTIKLLNIQTTQVRFWANVIQEGVGFPSDPVGHKRITISY